MKDVALMIVMILALAAACDPQGTGQSIGEAVQAYRAAVSGEKP